MSLDRRNTLIEEGYALVDTRDVALPHAVFKVDLCVEEKRALTLAEQTILDVVRHGADAPGAVAELMGLEQDVIVHDTVVEFLRRGLLMHRDVLAITPLGTQSLAEQKTIAERTYEDIWLRYDPFLDELLWQFDEGVEIQIGASIRDLGLHVIPMPEIPEDRAFERRHDEVQRLLDQEDIPKVDEARAASRTGDGPTGGEVESRELVRLSVRSHFIAWRRAEAEFWHHAEHDELDWRVVYRGGEVRAIREALHRMMEAGLEILPFDVDEETEVGEAAGVLSAAVSEVQQDEASPESRLLQGVEHRSAMEEAIGDARAELIIVSPWLRTAAVDDDLIGWLKKALDRWPELRVVVGYGIERDKGRQSWKDNDQRHALKRLNKLGERKSGRLRTVEIGNTHEKVIIRDRKAAIVTSFNFLSFNPRPGRGIRRETGVRIADPVEVERLRSSLVGPLGLPE